MPDKNIDSSEVNGGDNLSYLNKLFKINYFYDAYLDRVEGAREFVKRKIDEVPYIEKIKTLSAGMPGVMSLLEENGALIYDHTGLDHQAILDIKDCVDDLMGINAFINDARDDIEFLRDNLKDFSDVCKYTMFGDSVIDKLFSSIVISLVRRNIMSLNNYLQQGEGQFYNTIASQTTVEILDSIIQFEEACRLNMLLDSAAEANKALGYAKRLKPYVAPVKTLLSCISPQIMFALKLFDLNEVITGFLRASNLKKIKNKMQERLEERNLDPKFEKFLQEDLKQKGITLNNEAKKYYQELSRLLNDLKENVIFSEALDSTILLDLVSDLCKGHLDFDIKKLGLSEEDSIYVTEKLLKQELLGDNMDINEKAYLDFIKALGHYNEDFMPSDSNELNQKIDTVATDLKDSVEEMDLPGDLREKISEIVRSSVDEAKEAAKSFDSENGVFTKIPLIKRIGQAILSKTRSFERLKKVAPSCVKKLDLLKSKLKQYVDEKIYGTDDLNDLNTKLKKEKRAERKLSSKSKKQSRGV